MPRGINLVGSNGGVADPRGAFTIIVRDAGGVPLPTIPVVINFTNCSDIRVCTTQPQAGVTVQCSGASGSVTAMTDETGTVTLSLVGGATNSSAGVPGSVPWCATVYADGVNLTLPVGGLGVGAFDQNGAGGLNPADLSLLLEDSFSAGFEPRSDYNHSGSINPIDLSLWLQTFFAGGSSASCTAYCQ